MAIPVLAVSGGTGYLTSPDGVTWTSQLGLTSLPLLATETPTSLVYGTDFTGVPCWILTTFENVSTLTNTYRSYDGITWASFANSLPASTILFRMAAVGQKLVASVLDSAGVGFDRIVYSLDGGSTWLTTNLEALVGTAAHLSIAASNNQFLVATDAIVCASMCYGSPGGLGSK